MIFFSSHEGHFSLTPGSHSECYLALPAPDSLCAPSLSPFRSSHSSPLSPAPPPVMSPPRTTFNGGENTLAIDFISYTFMLLAARFHVTSNLQNAGRACHVMMHRRHHRVKKRPGPAGRAPLDFNGNCIYSKEEFCFQCI